MPGRNFQYMVSEKKARISPGPDLCFFTFLDILFEPGKSEEGKDQQ